MTDFVRLARDTLTALDAPVTEVDAEVLRQLAQHVLDLREALLNLGDETVDELPCFCNGAPCPNADHWLPCRNARAALAEKEPSR